MSLARFVQNSKSSVSMGTTLKSCNNDPMPRLTMQGMDYKEKIGNRIRAAREERGWKLRELAEKTDNVVSVSRLNNYEHGARMPGPQEAVLLGKALSKRAAYFLGVDDVQTVITTEEETLIRNWRTLPENERMQLYREIEVHSMRYRDPITDQRVERHMPTTKARARAKAKAK